MYFGWLVLIAGMIYAPPASAQGNFDELFLAEVEEVSGPDIRFPPNQNPRIGGSVERIEADGSFVMTDGSVIWQWGLFIGQEPQLALFLEGRSIGCDALFPRDNGWVGDCAAAASDSNGGSVYRLDLYRWLPELGWAVRACDEVENRHYATNGSSIVWNQDVGYRCLPDGTSFKSEVVNH